METMLLYTVMVNIIAFIMYGRDKKTAVLGRARIPEKSLIAIAVIGGSIGAYAAMRHFHHKTRKIKFSLGIPVIFLVQVGLIAYLLIR